MKNVVKILIIVFTVILILSGGVFAYLYFATDILKTDRQLFDKYISQNLEIIDIFKDESLASYYTKKLNTPYENKGKYKVTGIEEYLPENAKDMEIVFNGETDVQNNYKHEKIEVNYNKDTSMAVSLLQNGNYYGIKFEEILKKYLALENNNLKQFAKNIGMEDIEDVPDKIDLGSINKNTKFTEEELKEMKKIIQNRLKEDISDEKFTSSEQDDDAGGQKEKVYTLELTLLDMYNISKKAAEDFLNNDLVKNRLKEIYKSQNNVDDEEVDEYIEELKNKINENVNEDINQEEFSKTNIAFNVYTENKKMTKTEILIKDVEAEEESYKLGINYKQNGVEIETQDFGNDETNINISLEKTKKDDEINYQCTVKPDDSIGVKFVAKWTGINNIEKVNEQFGMEIQSDSENAKYVFTNNVTFVEDINEKINQKELKVINEYNEEQFQELINKLSSTIEQLNRKKMEQIGVEEDENPLIYYLPLFSTLMRGEDDVYIQAKEAQITNKVESAKERVKLDYMEYRTSLMQEQISTNEQISVTEYLKKHWTESSDPSLYTIKDGIITLSVPDIDGNYITATFDEQTRSLVWSDGKN